MRIFDQVESIYCFSLYLKYFGFILEAQNDEVTKTIPAIPRVIIPTNLFLIFIFFKLYNKCYKGDCCAS